MLWFIKLSLVLQQIPATMRSCTESHALLGVLQPPAMMAVPDKLIKQRVWDREMPAVVRAGREQLNAVPQAPADKEQKPALLLPTIPKLLCSPRTWQDAVCLLSPWDFAQLKGSSAFWGPWPGTQCPVWTSSREIEYKPPEFQTSRTVGILGYGWKAPVISSQQTRRTFIQTDQASLAQQTGLLARKLEGEGKWSWRQSPHLLVKAWGCTLCHSLQIWQVISQKKRLKTHVLLHGGTGYQWKSFPLGNSQAQKKAAQGGFAVSILGLLKTQLNEALRIMVWSQSWSHFEHEIELQTSWDSFNLIIPWFESLWSLQIPTSLPYSPKDIYCS